MNVFRRVPEQEYADRLTVSFDSKLVADILAGKYDLVIIEHPNSKREYHLDPKLIPPKLIPKQNKKHFDGYILFYVALFETAQRGKQYVPGLSA